MGEQIPTIMFQCFTARFEAVQLQSLHNYLILMYFQYTNYFKDLTPQNLIV